MPTLRLEETLDIAGAQELHARLGRLLEEEGPWTVDASAVERVDAAAAQLLHAFVREARTRCVQVAWRGVSPALREALGLLGLEATARALAEGGAAAPEGAAGEAAEEAPPQAPGQA